MKLGLKLFVATLLVVSIPLTLVNRYAVAYFDHFCRVLWEEEMVDAAHLTGRIWQAGLPAADRDALLAGHAVECNMRIRWVNADGRTVFDSGGAPDVKDLEKGEVRQALETRQYNARFQLSTGRERMYYFSALPVLSGDTLLGVAHVIRHTGPVTTAMFYMQENQRMAMLISCLVAGLLSLLFSWVLTRRLRRLQRSARHFGLTGDSRTLRQKGSDEVAELSGEFEAMAEALEQRQRYNRDFVLTTLHELKTPLTAMQGAADILQRETLSDEKRLRFAGNIMFEARRLGRLVEGLHELTSLELPQEGEERSEIDLIPWTQACIERLAPGFTHPIDVDSSADRLTVLAREDELEQVILNLLENAERYSPGNGRIRVRLAREGLQAVVSVEDDGVGIDADSLPRLFDRFYTTEPKGRSLEFGNGLGLAVVRTSVRGMGGEVFAENIETGGARIGFKVPVADLGKCP